MMYMPRELLSNICIGLINVHHKSLNEILQFFIYQVFNFFYNSQQSVKVCFYNTSSAREQKRMVINYRSVFIYNREMLKIAPYTYQFRWKI